MKKNLLTILALLSFAVCSAQLKIQSNYDVDGNGNVSIADVTSTVNKVLGKSESVKERVVVDGESLNDAFQDILSQLNYLNEQVAELKSMKCSCGCNQKDPYNGHEYVDLGLPSGLKWATMNVGASSPEDYGDYFAWGETVPYYKTGHSQDNPCTNWKTDKTGYNWGSYKWCSNGIWTGMTKYTYADNKTDGIWYNNGSFDGDNKTTLELADDAAHVNWGGDWRMPTKAELEELFNNCTWTWGVQNGVMGYLILSKTNKNSIFLPTTGYRQGNFFQNSGSYGYCWSSSLGEDDSSRACSFYFKSDKAGFADNQRFNGLPVRAVCP